MAKPQLNLVEDPALAARPCLDGLPYRMVVFKEINKDGTPVYLVAGSPNGPAGARKALREAHRRHGGNCFYCKDPVSPEKLTIDHAEPRRGERRDEIQNLLIACQPCNSGKAGQRIEFYRPDAGREWLSSVLRQVQERLSHLSEGAPASPS